METFYNRKDLNHETKEEMENAADATDEILRELSEDGEQEEDEDEQQDITYVDMRIMTTDAPGGGNDGAYGGIGGNIGIGIPMSTKTSDTKAILQDLKYPNRA